MTAGSSIPNCKHHLSTYYPGDQNEDSGDPRDKNDQKYLKKWENSPDEIEHMRLQSQIQQQKRIAAGSMEQAKINQAQNNVDQLEKQDAALNLSSSAESTNTKQVFTDAKTIEEVQSYAKQFIGTGYSKTFKNEADYSGISLDHANEINRTMEELYSKYDMSKINGIKVISPTSALGKKVFASEEAVAAYNPVEHGIFINKNILKDPSALSKYNEESKKAWNIVMDNIDSLTGSQKELALKYRNAGRDLVGDGSLHDYIVHEMGHHVECDVLDTKTNNLIGSSMSKYAPHISGYANASKGEYIAESFVAYSKGETDILDPEFIKFMKSKNIQTELSMPDTKDLHDTVAAIDKSFKTLAEKPNITRKELTKLFPKKTEIGTNPYTGKLVTVHDKDYSYFIHKHGGEGSLSMEDVKNIPNVLDYDILAKDIDDKGNITGYIFIKRDLTRDGYYEAVSKTIDENAEEIFHYQFKGNKSAAKSINKLKRKNLIIKSKIDIK